ncbi:pyridine nucleotide-disulfide oxidoreductase [Aeromicrobium sp. PE09-221]|uniref:dihydrolipoyl dehydrogenase family protein n=1 Tax=Aeromicrobium sp. PE09-221 TaxID=1898043 RepID=UPI000B3EAC86|nr:NAD(P)/FAD-dependent oxidoreductase [Aeromicrobium sp. PE09-221]OUZ06652.1 pyridine nucleotide-disulfide oxidoreductase [Aeromicrobium sp. PE09-221]
MNTCDVVVIGTGPGGESLATRLAGEGLDVVAVEAELVGGECPYWGCIPSKMMIRAANALAEAQRAGRLGGRTEAQPDFSLVADRIRREATSDWDDSAAADRLTRAGVRLVRGRGVVVGERTVEAADERFQARLGIVLNTGTVPAVPPIDGLDATPYWTNREAVAATEAPASLAVIGGGAIGLELAQAYARFGTAVTILEVADRILAVEEPESSDALCEALQSEGITVRESVSIDRVDHGEDGFTISLSADEVRAERLLVATGRRARIHDLGLEELGVDTSAKTLTVDDEMALGPGLWAIGDIAGRGQFTHVSMYQAARVGDVLLGRDPGPYDTSLPRVTFTDPEIGAVGLTESQARGQGIDVRSSNTEIPASSRGFIHGPGNDGFLKLVVDAERDVLVGATSAGPSGGETLSLLALAVRAEVPLDVLRNMIYPYPTFYRAIESAL